MNARLDATATTSDQDAQPRGAQFSAGGPGGEPSPLRQAIARATRLPEARALAPLLALARQSPAATAHTHALARTLVQGLREGPGPSGRAGRVQSLMQEYALSSEEGVALMCLAEALLRIPDAATRDALIRDKIGRGEWQQHLGRSDSLFVNAASWGLLLTGKLVATHNEGRLLDALTRLVGKRGETLIRQGVQLAMQMLGEQFVTGETIAQALQRARALEAKGFRYSYDMLGEAALTEADAQRYLQAYENAIHAIGRAAQGRGIYQGPGISIKLSALHPRYSRTQHARVMGELLPRVLHLCELARHYDIGLNIDAEEADQLETSLDLLQALCEAPALQGWHGIGFVIQAYGKRCPAVIDFLVDLARRTSHRLMVRLVKGAYWDSEIKRAQLDGQSDYPVYTRKHHTDVAYLACARKLLSAPEQIYPQFATHNAHTLAAIVHMAQEVCGRYQPGQYEFQCLHGMGEPLYMQVVGADTLGQAMALLVREAGKTWAHAVAELREAVDFLRYYAAQLQTDFDKHTHVALGPVVCISPWNFPLAIFLGQVAAALAAGNPVLAKPAEQTPAVAAFAVQTLWRAGLPRAAVQLLPGSGREVGQPLVADARVQGVLFTGSTQTAKVLQATLAKRLNAHGQVVPLIAETGGQNCMVVDSSALLEQVVQDAVASAFEAAGQRCSALRVLCVQDDVADRLVGMLLGAMAEIRMGAPAQLHTDMGPVIDARAREGIEAHVAKMQAAGRKVHRILHPDSDALAGTFVPPTLIEIERIDELEREVFGPVLHVLRWRREQLDELLTQIEATGYALTLGVHSRIDETIARVLTRTRAGNIYINRNMVGAVVGVQPFGGEGLSGTGPKAGGPLYLLRLLARCPQDAALRSVQACGASALPQATPALQALHDWAAAQGKLALAHHCARLAASHPAGLQAILSGPTGERNVYQVKPRESVLCCVGAHPNAEDDALLQIAAVLAVGSSAVLPRSAAALHSRLPVPVQAALRLSAEDSMVGVDAALLHGNAQEALALAARLAAQQGPIVSLTVLTPGSVDVPLARLVTERSTSTNTAAAGGNASLMTLEA